MIAVSSDEKGPSRSGEEAAWRLVDQSGAIDRPRVLPVASLPRADLQLALTPRDSSQVTRLPAPGLASTSYR